MLSNSLSMFSASTHFSDWWFPKRRSSSPEMEIGAVKQRRATDEMEKRAIIVDWFAFDGSVVYGRVLDLWMRIRCIDVFDCDCDLETNI